MLCHAGGFLGFMPGGSLLPIILIGLIGYWLFKNFTVTRSKPIHSGIVESTNASSIELLNRKFASGELTESEYLRKKDLLRQ